MKYLLLLVVLLVGCSPPTLQQQHANAMKQHRYIEDIDQYGRQDVWVASLRGDCEDYALWMKRKVGGKLLYVVTQKKELHVVLDVDGQVVDNLSKVVYDRKDMKHKLIFEMSEEQVQQFMESRK